MQLLEIHYSEKFDTFTGYLANGPDYFRYEVDMQHVELTPIDERYEDVDDFIRQTSRMNPQASFLVDPLAIKEINYKELERYKRLSLTTQKDQSGRAATFPVKTVVVIVSLLLAAFYYAATIYSNQKSESKQIIPSQVEPQNEIRYIYEIHLVSGGTLEGLELKRDRERILVKNKKGLQVTLELPAVRYIEKIQEDNSLSRSVIYGSKP